MEENQMILRDYLAIDRTKLANQRTLLSYMRTSLYLVVSALALFNVESLEDIKYVGYLLFMLSIVTFIFGICNYRKFKKTIDKAYQKGGG